MKTKAYTCMKVLIKTGKRTRDELLDMADVYYAAGRLDDTQYTEIITLINEKYPVENTTAEGEIE